MNLPVRKPLKPSAFQIVYTYMYLIAIVWMVWCTLDIVKFRRRWMKLTSTVHDQQEYMTIVERSPHQLSYFPDIHSNGGLFMRIGAGCSYNRRLAHTRRELFLSSVCSAVHGQSSFDYDRVDENDRDNANGTHPTSRNPGRLFETHLCSQIDHVHFPLGLSLRSIHIPISIWQRKCSDGDRLFRKAAADH